MCSRGTAFLSAGKTSPGQHEGCLGQAQPIPTPVTRTQARGGCSAAAMALAKVFVVSTRLLMTSLEKASPHLEKGEPWIIRPTRTPQDTLPPRGIPATSAHKHSRGHRNSPHPRAKGRCVILQHKCRGALEDGGSSPPLKDCGFWTASGQNQQRS